MIWKNSEKRLKQKRSSRLEEAEDRISQIEDKM
jgi:hypothetical protein